MNSRIVIICIFSVIALLFHFGCNRKLNSDKKGIGERVTDIDGNVYKTIKIDTQIWMAENLKVTRFRNGDQIQNVDDAIKWENLLDAAFCNYQNNKIFGKKYGNLYNWNVVNDSRGLCPEGWHVPSDEDWQILSDFLGGNNVAGNKMKETGFKHWAEPNEGATNESGFTALPGGGRDEYGKFIINKYGGHWWSSTEDGSIDGLVRSIYYGYGSLMRDSYHKNSGFSVRCLKD